MTDARSWNRASRLPSVIEGRPRPAVAALAPGAPDVPELFEFMRDAELRFGSLRMRIEERTGTANGEHLVVTDLALRHPGHARVTTTEPVRGTAANYEIWISDGETVRTYSAHHKLGTQRPVRHTVRGLDRQDLPGMALVYWPLTPLPMETLPDTFIHPAGYCQNVLATGRCWISGTDVVAGRECIVIECDHPRTVEVEADRPDFHVTVAVDRADGVILRLTETIGGIVTRDAEAVVYQPDAPLPPSAFQFTFPTGTRMMF
jgi:outer membrane lipoprotein-sorting protein